MTAWEDRQTSKPPDLSSDVGQSSERAFHCFVNKLSQLCDSERRGKTVTAFVVLEFPDRIQYRFASNQRDNKALNRTHEFLTDVLSALGEVNKCNFREKMSHILQKSLSFARPRLEEYVKALKKYTRLCISSCEEEGTAESEFEIHTRV
jgi:hypothetical protein